MINPFKKKCESLVTLDENVKILDKPELDAIFYLISKFKSIGDEDKYKEDELITPQATACMIAFSEMFPANALFENKLFIAFNDGGAIHIVRVNLIMMKLLLFLTDG